MFPYAMILYINQKKQQECTTDITESPDLKCLKLNFKNEILLHMESEHANQPDKLR